MPEVEQQDRALRDARNAANRRGCVDYLKSKFVIPVVALATIGIGTLWYMGSCNKTDTQEPRAEEPAPVELTEEQRVIDNHMASAKLALTNLGQDGYSREELLTVVIPGYENLKQLKDKVADAPELLKGNLRQVLNAYWGVIDNAFGESDVFGYVGIDNWRQERKNAGGVNPLSVGKGKDLTTLITEAQKIALLTKSRDAWSPYRASRVRGSQRFSKQDVYATSEPIPTEQFKKVLDACGSFGDRSDASQDYLDTELWQDLTNGDLRDSEVCIDGPDGEYTRFSAVYKGHSE